MTENLLQKLEEKVLTLLTELELMKNELQQARQENTDLRADRASTAKKLQGLLGLLETLDKETQPLYMPELDASPAMMTA